MTMSVLEPKDSLSETFQKWWRRTKFLWFTPANKLNIRNVPKSWTDRDDIMFHAIFTIICDFVEKEYGGRDELAEDAENENAKPQQVILAIYDWYNEIDWSDPVPTNTAYQELMKRVEYKQIPVDAPTGAYRIELVGDPTDVANLKLARAEHLERQAEFDEVCEENLSKALMVRRYLWT